MNRTNYSSTSTFFKPASQYLKPALTSFAGTLRKDTTRDDEDIEDGTSDSLSMDDRLSRVDRGSTHELTPRSIPLISLSRSPSPFARIRSAAQSEDEDEYELGEAAQSRPLVAEDIGSGGRSNTNIVKEGGLGQFLFGTTVGWQIYLGLLVFWVGGCQFGLLLMNRFIMLTGTYKFSYPLTMTLLQLLISQVLLLGFASLTRGLGGCFRWLGLGAVVSPSQAYTKGNRSNRYQGGQRHRSLFQNLKSWLIHGSGGIAGGGLFEFQWRTAKHVLPVAVIFAGKVILSNISYAYAVLPMYMLARIAIIPLSLLLTAVLLRQSHSVQSLSSSLTAMLNLLMASIQPDRVTWESIVAGVFSSLFVALYPIVLLRAYRQLVSDLVPQGDLLAPAEDEISILGTKEETRAYWRILHYTSLLSLAITFPLVLISGELGQIRHNCYFLDVPWFWFLMLCGGIGSWAVFVSFLLLVKATSPFTATFVSVPRSAFQLAVLGRFRLPIHSWVGVSLCWASCLWFVVVRRREDRAKERVRLEGR